MTKKSKKWTPLRLFQGRIRRAPFFLGLLVSIGIVVGYFLYNWGVMYPNFRLDWTALIFLIVGLIFQISFILRRLYDLGLSGWWLPLYFVPTINAFFLLFLVFHPGEKEENKHGKRDERKFWQSLLNF